MMDFEFKIRMLEKELTHYREMQEIMRPRLDTHDLGIEAIVETLARAAASQEETNVTVKTLAGDLKALTETVTVMAGAVSDLQQKFAGLIDALRAGTNGHH